MATFNRTDSRLLSEISWHTNLILGPEDLQDADFQACSLDFTQLTTNMTGFTGLLFKSN